MSSATPADFPPALQPTLGVSSLDLCRSPASGPFFLPASGLRLQLAPHRSITQLPTSQGGRTRVPDNGRTRSARLTYATAGLLRCNKTSLQFVRRTSNLWTRRQRWCRCPPWAFPP
jgi:hypothetical protein